MSSRFPHPCTRCGTCCLMQTCPIGQRVYHVTRDELCPGLTFEPDGRATCQLAAQAPNYWAPQLGVGAGCCLSAVVVQAGRPSYFAGLPANLKQRVAAGIRSGRTATAVCN